MSNETAVSEQTSPSSCQTDGTADVTVCGLGRSLVAPCFSPFTLKLQAYLRMAGIKYKFEGSLKMSSKGKIPYIIHKGKQVEDTSFIVEYLNKEYSVDLNAHLSLSEKGISVAFQRLIEENLNWPLTYERWILKYNSLVDILPFPSFKKKMFKLATSSPFGMKSKVQANMHGHGIGRHSKEDIFKIAEKDLTSISNFLGDKPFLMGSKPSQVDASVFGHIGILMFAATDFRTHKFVKDNLPNLVTYCERMRERFWPDWNDRVAENM